MSIRRQGSLNPTLTNFAVGVSQDLSSALAEFIAPTVDAPDVIGQYKEFSEKNAFQLLDSRRPVGGPATRIQFDVNDPTYNCKPHALEVAVDDSERRPDAENPFAPDEAKITTLIQAATLSHEAEVLEKMRTQPAVSGVGIWSDASVDPIAELDGQIEALITATGRVPNRMVIGATAWTILRNHPKVIARQPGAAIVGITLAQLAQMLRSPSIEIREGVLSGDANKFGKGKAASNLLGAELTIFYASPFPTLYDPSFMKTISVGGKGGVTSVWTYRDNSCRSDIHAVDWSSDIKLTSAVCGRRIVLS